jgi:hypothetical protein
MHEVDAIAEAAGDPGQIVVGPHAERSGAENTCPFAGEGTASNKGRVIGLGRGDAGQAEERPRRVVGMKREL